MADDDDDDTGPDEGEIREALRRLHQRAGEDEPTISDVITLWNATRFYTVKLLPEHAEGAIIAMLDTRRDVANGGVDQVVWNHGVELSRAYADEWSEVGMVENAALLRRLADSLEAYNATHGDAIEKDVVHHFIAWRKSVGGPAFGIPDPQEEMSEPLVEYVVAHASEIPAPDAELPRKPPGSDDADDDDDDDQ